MRNAECIRHAARIVNILPGAARTFFAHSHAMVVKLQGDADDLIPLMVQMRGNDGRIHPAGHGDDHAGLAFRLVESEAVHGAGYKRLCAKLQGDYTKPLLFTYKQCK